MSGGEMKPVAAPAPEEGALSNFPKLSQLTSGLSLIAQKLPVIVWNTDDKLRLTALAGAGLALLGIRPEDYLGSSLLQTYQERGPSGDQESAFVGAHRQALAGAALQLQNSYREREYEVYMQPLRADTGQIIGTTGV